MSNFNSFPHSNGGFYNFHQASPFANQAATSGMGMAQGQQGQFDGRQVASHPAQEQAFNLFSRTTASVAAGVAEDYYGQERVHNNSPEMDIFPVPLAFPTEGFMVDADDNSGEEPRRRSLLPPLPLPTGRTMSDIPCIYGSPEMPADGVVDAVDALKQGMSGLAISGQPR